MADSAWLIVRGISSLVVGIVAILWPGITLIVLSSCSPRTRCLTALPTS